MSKVVLVTGASSGMGHEAAILLAKEGHHVYAGARRMGRMADLADYGITAVELDVTNGDDNERVVNQVIEGEGRIDVLINNAGFGLYGPVEDVALLRLQVPARAAHQDEGSPAHHGPRHRRQGARQGVRRGRHH